MGLTPSKPDLLQCVADYPGPPTLFSHLAFDLQPPPFLFGGLREMSLTQTQKVLSQVKKSPVAHLGLSLDNKKKKKAL